ncbi:MAG: AMP-binding protein [Chromatiales bacterium]|nr:AMP-binding protein [Chromatiales bacterium]
MLTSNPYFGTARERRAGTVGLPLPGVGVRVVRRRRPRRCAAGEIGSIEVHGPNVFSGYWRMPEKTAEEFTADGWFRTGDVGAACDGRRLPDASSAARKDLIITGGYNVYPKEIEGYIDELPGVAESAVIGVPHPDFGEAVVAVVVGARRARRADAAGDRRGAARARSPTSRCPSACSSSPSCRATRWARCRRTCYATAARPKSAGNGDGGVPGAWRPPRHRRTPTTQFRSGRWRKPPAVALLISQLLINVQPGSTEEPRFGLAPARPRPAGTKKK